MWKVCWLLTRYKEKLNHALFNASALVVRELSIHMCFPASPLFNPNVTLRNCEMQTANRWFIVLTDSVLLYERCGRKEPSYEWNMNRFVRDVNDVLQTALRVRLLCQDVSCFYKNAFFVHCCFFELASASNFFVGFEFKFRE